MSPTGAGAWGRVSWRNKHSLPSGFHTPGAGHALMQELLARPEDTQDDDTPLIVEDEIDDQALAVLANGVRAHVRIGALPVVGIAAPCCTWSTVTSSAKKGSASGGSAES